MTSRAKPVQRSPRSKPAAAPAVSDREIEAAIERVIDTFRFLSPARVVTEVRRVLPVKPAKADVLRGIDALAGRGVLTRRRHGVHRFRPPEPGADERRRRFENRCLFPIGEPAAFEQLRTAIKARFEVSSDTGTRLAFCWRSAAGVAGPTLQLGECSLDELASFANAARTIKSSTACAVLSFDDRNAVLDEANTLIEAQRVLLAITQRPCFLMWNGARVDP